jgi:hypothetical protein
MCDADNLDVSFGAQFTSFMCIKELHQLLLNYFRQRDTGIYLILKAVCTAYEKLKRNLNLTPNLVPNSAMVTNNVS